MKYKDFYDYAKIAMFDPVALMGILKKFTKIELIELCIESLDFFLESIVQDKIKEDELAFEKFGEVQGVKQC